MASSGKTEHPDAEINPFRASMPPWYRRAYGLRAIVEHAGIVERRGDRIAHVELWRIRRGAVVVMVSDHLSGGLAMMSAAIAAAGFDIVLAEAYRRTRGARPAESVALFELRRPNDAEIPITQEQVAPIAVALESQILGLVSAEKLFRRHATTIPPGLQGPPEVSFADDEEASILLVEARDRPGLLATITAALAETAAQITDSEIVTVDGRVRDRFQLTEADGSALSASRRSDVAARVGAVIE
jgi:UTP:GlnB (protein PII) uridylyltransferase